MFAKYRKVIGGALIVAGTSIGAGMLALPVVTGVGGFFPALLIYLAVWVIVTATGLLLAELSLRFPEGTNLISMANHYLGKAGKVFCWIFFIFLCYTISIAYLSKGGSLIQMVTGEAVPYNLCMIIFLLIFGAIVYFGAKTVDRMNILLMVGLIGSYLALLFVGSKHINFSYYLKTDLSLSALSLPVILTSFGYQIVVPSLTDYLEKNAKKVRQAIIIGTTITLIIYLFWEMLILGVLPIEVLKQAKVAGETAIEPLKNFAKIKAVYGIGQFFSFFAITTSFLGVELALFDFLADGLKLPKRGIKKVYIAAITFIPPLIITLLFPNLFIIALGYAGGIGVNFLMIFLPAWMAWKGHYIMKDRFLFDQLPRERLFLIFIFVFSAAEVLIEIIDEVIRISS